MLMWSRISSMASSLESTNFLSAFPFPLTSTCPTPRHLFLGLYHPNLALSLDHCYPSHLHPQARLLHKSSQKYIRIGDLLRPISTLPQQNLSAKNERADQSRFSLHKYSVPSPPPPLCQRNTMPSSNQPWSGSRCTCQYLPHSPKFSRGSSNSQHWI